MGEEKLCRLREHREGGLALGKRRCYDRPQPEPGPEPGSEAAIKALDAWAGVLCVLRFADCMQRAATATGCYCDCDCYCYCHHCVYYTVMSRPDQMLHVSG